MVPNDDYAADGSIDSIRRRCLNSMAGLGVHNATYLNYYCELVESNKCGLIVIYILCIPVVFLFALVYEICVMIYFILDLL